MIKLANSFAIAGLYFLIRDLENCRAVDVPIDYLTNLTVEMLQGTEASD